MAAAKRQRVDEGAAATGTTAAGEVVVDENRVRLVNGTSIVVSGKKHENERKSESARVWT